LRVGLNGLVGVGQDQRVARFYRLVRLVIDLLVLRGLWVPDTRPGTLTWCFAAA
jgi:hypothetical protein